MRDVRTDIRLCAFEKTWWGVAKVGKTTENRVHERNMMGGVFLCEIGTETWLRKHDDEGCRSELATFSVI